MAPAFAADRTLNWALLFADIEKSDARLIELAMAPGLRGRENLRRDALPGRVIDHEREGLKIQASERRNFKSASNIKTHTDLSLVLNLPRIAARDLAAFQTQKIANWRRRRRDTHGESAVLAKHDMALKASVS